VCVAERAVEVSNRSTCGAVNSEYVFYLYQTSNGIKTSRVAGRIENAIRSIQVFSGGALSCLVRAACHFVLLSFGAALSALL
jgi:hypothetical protein